MAQKKTKPSKKRDYRKEYAQRIANARKKGLSRAQARGHARPGEKPIRAKTPLADPKLDAALLAMREGKTQGQAAKDAGVSVERFRRFLYGNKLAKRKGRQWIFSDNRIREMSVLSNGDMRHMRLRGFDEASLNGKYFNAVRKSLDNGDPSFLEDFEGKSVRDEKGKSHPLETDLNELYRLYHSRDEPFEVYYKLLSLPK